MEYQSENKTCQNCKQDFTIESDDFAFYEKIKVPPPTFCPECRLQRRLAWRNERSLYKRNCNLCKDSMFAIYPADTPFPVYCNRCWFSDDWDVIDYGKEYDFSKPFFQQFQELKNKVPRLNLQIVNCTKTEYANAITHSKNCYLTYSTANSEDCIYTVRSLNSKNITDSYLIKKSDGCFNCLNCEDSSNLNFCQNVSSSFDLYFCFDMKASSNCFMSTVGRHANYLFRNKKLTKEQYFYEIKNIDFGSYEVLLSLEKEFKELKQNAIRKYSQINNTIETTGDFVSNTKNCKMCFYGSNLDNCKYIFFGEDTKDSMDSCYACCTSSLLYEVSSVGVNCSNILFSKDAWPEVRDVEYTDSCRNNVNNLFGCISLRNKSFCILNKQYSKEEYFEMVKKIKKHMMNMPYVDKRGLVYGYGEFFPIELSPHKYNETSALNYFPLLKEDALLMGFGWQDIQEKSYTEMLLSKDLPDNIKEINTDILNKIINCMHSGSCNEQCTIAFKVIPRELDIHKALNIALPRLCPNCRSYELFNQLPKPKLYIRKCMCDKENHNNHKGNCGVEFETSYAPDRPEIVYCESCYQKEVI